jgi:hypothetical protein
MRHAALPVFLIGITLSGHMNIDETGVLSEQQNINRSNTNVLQQLPLATDISRSNSLSACRLTRDHCLRNP